MKTLSHIIVATLLLCSCSTRKEKIDLRADAIYFGGGIYSMDAGFNAMAEAVAVKDGKVIYIGSRAAAEKFMGIETQMHDLSGKTFFAGILAHSHDEVNKFKSFSVVPRDSTFNKLPVEK
jgi:hypothetical protein